MNLYTVKDLRSDLEAFPENLPIVLLSGDKDIHEITAIAHVSVLEEDGVIDLVTLVSDDTDGEILREIQASA